MVLQFQSQKVNEGGVASYMFGWLWILSCLSPRLIVPLRFKSSFWQLFYTHLVGEETYSCLSEVKTNKLGRIWTQLSKIWIWNWEIIMSSKENKILSFFKSSFEFSPLITITLALPIQICNSQSYFCFVLSIILKIIF